MFEVLNSALIFFFYAGIIFEPLQNGQDQQLHDMRWNGIRSTYDSVEGIYSHIAQSTREDEKPWYHHLCSFIYLNRLVK